jgi:predicted RNA-binding protein associated with RNAse of E/G family
VTPRPISIHYRRLPDRERIFHQTLVAEGDDHSITLLQEVDLEQPVRAGDTIILEPGAPIVWFTFPGLSYDVGRFYLRDGTFTGYYANILTPVEMNGDTWRTTDLCLDVWLGRDGSVQLLDEDEFRLAVEQGWMDGVTARQACETAASLAASAAAGAWPNDIVRAWTLERARSVLSAS